MKSSGTPRTSRSVDEHIMGGSSRGHDIVPGSRPGSKAGFDPAAARPHTANGDLSGKVS